MLIFKVPYYRFCCVASLCFCLKFMLIVSLNILPPHASSHFPYKFSQNIFCERVYPKMLPHQRWILLQITPVKWGVLFCKRGGKEVYYSSKIPLISFLIHPGALGTGSSFSMYSITICTSSFRQNRSLSKHLWQQYLATLAGLVNFLPQYVQLCSCMRGVASCH